MLYPPAVHWGVDSVSRADRLVGIPARYRQPTETAHTRITLFDYVERRMGRPPEFWGRYINRRLPQDPVTGQTLSPASGQAITPDEAGFLHGRGCRVMLVYNGSRGRSARHRALTGHRRGGEQAAAYADMLCEQLGVPGHVVVFADAEHWNGDVGWLRGWYEALRAVRRRGGIYGRPVRVVENPAHPARAYGTPLHRIRSRATRDEAERRIGWHGGRLGTTPRRVTTRAYWGDELEQAMADVLVDTVIGQGFDPFRDAGYEPFHVFSNEPRRVMNAESDRALDGTDIPTEFVPAEPARSSGIVTSVWQYLQNALFVSARRGSVDMNLASPRGLAAMW